MKRVTTAPIWLHVGTLGLLGAEQVEDRRDNISRDDSIGQQVRYWLLDHVRSFRATAKSIERRRSRSGKGRVAIDAIRGRTPDEIRGLVGELADWLREDLAALREGGEHCICKRGHECTLCRGERLVSQATEILT